MELCQKKEILLLVPAVCISFSAFFSETLVFSDHDHDCIGEGCPICLQIETADNFLNTMKLAGIFFLLTAYFVFFAYAPKKHTDYKSCLLSLVELKVRFNS
jgi:predicted transporter